MTDDQYRDFLRSWSDKTSGYPADLETWSTFAQGIHYLTGDYRNPAIYADLSKMLADNDEARKTGGNRIYYLATAPSHAE